MLLVADVRASLRRDLSDDDRRTMEDPDLRKRVNVSRSSIPAVTHVDYSARVQTVDMAHHPRFYKIIKQFKNKTGSPVVINTSFNVRGEPIVCTPADAYQCFMRTHIDYLVLGPYLLDKTKQPEWKESGDWRQEFQLD